MISTRRRASPGVILGVLAASGFVASFMQTIIIPIQSELPALLNADLSDTSWAVTVTLLSGAIANPIAGRLGDLLGKRRIVLTMMLFLVAGSLIAAMAYSVVVLIIGRAFQGLGMAAIPVGIALLRDLLPKERLVSSIALMSAMLVIGGSLGLPISALVAQFFEWHVLFWCSAVAGIICILLVFRYVPTGVPPVGGRVDIVGALLLSLGLVAVLLAGSKAMEWGYNSPLTLLCAGGGVALLLFWGWFELRITDPIVDLRSSVQRPVLMTNLASVAMGFALFTTSVTLPQLLVQPEHSGGMGLPLVAAGLVLAPSGVVSLVMSPIVGSLERRIGTKLLLVYGAIVMAIAYSVAAAVELTVGWILLVNLINGVGVALGYAAMPTLIMQAVPAAQAGAANGLNTLMRGIGTSAGTVVTSAILAGSIVSAVGYPSMFGYRVAFICGLGAALVCAALAMGIPKRTEREVRV